MSVVRRTQLAEHDLQNIAFRVAIADGRPEAADRIIDELVEQCDRLAQFCGTAVRGTAVSEIGEGVRLLAYKRWVIIFRYCSDGVDILRFADGSQDYLSWILQSS